MASERALRHPERHLERTELSVANLKFVLIFCQIDKISREICDMSEMSQEKKLVILEKRPKKDGRKCMIKSCQYQEENGWVTIPQDERRRKDFCEAIGVSSVRPGDRLCRRHFLPTDFGPKFLKRNAVPTQNLVSLLSEIPSKSLIENCVTF